MRSIWNSEDNRLSSAGAGAGGSDDSIETAGRARNGQGMAGGEKGPMGRSMGRWAADGRGQTGRRADGQTGRRADVREHS
ncbi:hypothetical protein BO71DRAFT_400504 [Aspergillus ellipticus CBS 707.79]|uniref:Uncharacterized protein n=1 Tax=Aspergillus ellipticus CBS 707.79 TaxID=1448320 RepID=A0A319D4U1_9EURO|nr:hypothetical protein BO71DRAFT_400504 [Aspergillus ellipticus CBS 707.79]